jgi:chorismate mutase
VLLQARTYGRDLGPTGEPIESVPGQEAMKIDVQGVRELYESYIIPLTKEVEVRLCTY